MNDIAPAWHEEITFDNVPYPPPSKIAITIVYRSGKKDEVLGVACPGSNLWTTGAAPPQVCSSVFIYERESVGGEYSRC